MAEIFFWPLLTGCLCLEVKIRNDSIFPVVSFPLRSFGTKLRSHAMPVTSTLTTYAQLASGITANRHLWQCIFTVAARKPDARDRSLLIFSDRNTRGGYYLERALRRDSVYRHQSESRHCEHNSGNFRDICNSSYSLNERFFGLAFVFVIPVRFFLHVFWQFRDCAGTACFSNALGFDATTSRNRWQDDSQYAVSRQFSS